MKYITDKSFKENIRKRKAATNSTIMKKILDKVADEIENDLQNDLKRIKKPSKNNN